MVIDDVGVIMQPYANRTMRRFLSATISPLLLYLFQDYATLDAARVNRTNMEIDFTVYDPTLVDSFFLGAPGLNFFPLLQFYLTLQLFLPPSSRAYLEFPENIRS